jgi:hypothetical protein
MDWLSECIHDVVRDVLVCSTSKPSLSLLLSALPSAAAF